MRNKTEGKPSKGILHIIRQWLGYMTAPFLLLFQNTRKKFSIPFSLLSPQYECTGEDGMPYCCTACSELFDPLACRLVKLYYSHYILIEHINKVGAIYCTAAPEISPTLEVLSQKLTESSLLLAEAIGRKIGRKLILHRVERRDTLWKLAQRYSADMTEMVRLNHMKYFFRLKENSIILIPLKNNRADIK